MSNLETSFVLSQNRWDYRMILSSLFFDSWNSALDTRMWNEHQSAYKLTSFLAFPILTIFVVKCSEEQVVSFDLCVVVIDVLTHHIHPLQWEKLANTYIFCAFISEILLFSVSVEMLYIIIILHIPSFHICNAHYFSYPSKNMRRKNPCILLLRIGNLLAVL